MKITIIILIIILLIILLTYKISNKEYFIDDYLRFASNPVIFNESYPKKFIRAIQVGYHAKLDHQNRVETITIGPPLPESGETECHRVVCPPALSDIICWKCK